MYMYNGQKGSLWALSPLILFIVLFLGVGIATGDFTIMPLNVAVIVAAIFGLIIHRKVPFNKKVEVFTKGAGHSNILLMVLIYLLAGAFSQATEDMGGVCLLYTSPSPRDS